MHEYKSSIEFVIEKIENNTIHISNFLYNKTHIPVPNADFAPVNETVTPYDSNGAAKYIVIVILMYGFAIVFFIGSQVRSSRKDLENVDSQNAEQVLRQMESVIFAKEVLNKLLDKEHRERAWKIYLTNSSQRQADEQKELVSGKENCKETRMNELIQTLERKSINSNLSRASKFDQLRKNWKNFSLFRKTSKKDQKIKKKNRNPKVPQIQLETDIEGLMLLKESRRPQRAPTDTIPAATYETIKPSTSSNTITVPNTKKKSLKRVQYSEVDETRSVISFDACIVSEQVTTV